MASQGPLNASNITQSPSGTSWLNDIDILNDDANVASVSLAAEGQSKILFVTMFGFSIPTTATIDGVVVEINDILASGSTTGSVALTKDGSTLGTTRAAGGVSGWNTFGNSTDMWGITMTPTEVNNSNFGLGLEAADGGFSGEYSADAVRMTVYYTEVATQTAYPDADTDASTWTATPLWQKVDEPTTPSDADFITATAT